MSIESKARHHFYLIRYEELENGEYLVEANYVGESQIKEFTKDTGLKRIDSWEPNFVIPDDIHISSDRLVMLFKK